MMHYWLIWQEVGRCSDICAPRISAVILTCTLAAFPIPLFSEIQSRNHPSLRTQPFNLSIISSHLTSSLSTPISSLTPSQSPPHPSNASYQSALTPHPQPSPPHSAPTQTSPYKPPQSHFSTHDSSLAAQPRPPSHTPSPHPSP